MRLSWDATDATSGAASFDISWDTADAGVQVLHDHTGATSMNYAVTNYDNDCGGGFSKSYRWVTARDHRGYTATSPRVSDHLDVWDEAGVDSTRTVDNLTVARTGTWSTSNCLCHNHGKTTFSTARGASLTFTVFVTTPGQTVALVAPTSSNRGVMNVSVDGGAAVPVNTYASATVNRVIVWQQTLNAGLHTVRIVNAGTSGRSRVDVDTLMLGPAWSGEAPRYYASE
jgi:hypothetical protein